MVNWSKLYALIRFLPEVQRADRLIPNDVKVAYTVLTVFIFSMARLVPPYGVPLEPVTAASEPLGQGWHSFVSNSSLMTLGILPMLVSEIITHTLGASGIINMDRDPLQAHKLLNKVPTLIGILVTIGGATAHVQGLCSLGNCGTGTALLILAQFVFFGILVIYIDDALKKGYGLFPSISLFTASTICENILWKTFSPMLFIDPKQAGTDQFEGAVTAWVRLLITRTDRFSAMREALFYNQKLPHITNLLATCVFVLITIFFQGMSIVLPVKSDNIPRFQVNYVIKVSNIFFGLIIIHRSSVSLMYNFSKVLYLTYGGDYRLLNLLGTWKISNSYHFQEYFLVDGILYYITTPPPALTDLHRAPFHAFIYGGYLLGSYVCVSAFWLRICECSRRFSDDFIDKRLFTLVQPDAIPPNESRRHVLKAVRFGGFCLGAWIILGDLLGVLGSGTGIVLAVSALSPYLDGRAGKVGPLGF
ncbi:hypothetical protein BS78_04G102600 [Paspalum vaginatum]|nr:hypothetical protein BS78_04G102600 [Paspalum vaginatum]KAJ1278750.1 hypothetical protein BS78_04G102600 [Paspalum vaginatum]